MNMLKIIIGSLVTKNTKYAAAEKIQGTWSGSVSDGYPALLIAYT
jgi:hypothetical protein